MKFTSGLPESLCGAGSTLAETEALRADLPRLLRQFDVKRLLDAPCGDFNWMADVDLSGITYIGGDCNEDNLAAACKRADRDFRPMDIVRDDLPPADAMLCRDFHQHLPNRMVFSALRNYIASGIPWLIATTHDNEVNDDIPRAGLFRRLNLQAEPFRLPAPIVALPDPVGSGHFLAVWSRVEVMVAIC